MRFPLPTSRPPHTVGRGGRINKRSGPQLLDLKKGFPLPVDRIHYTVGRGGRINKGRDLKKINKYFTRK